MKKIFIVTLVLFLNFVSTVLNGQFSVEGQVVDAERLDPVPYVNIGIVELSTGTVSDFEGQFTLAAPDEDQLITFSAVGYETTTLSWTHVEQEGIIPLKRATYMLEPIDIVATRLDEKVVQLGQSNKTRGQSFSFGSSQIGTEIGAPIRINSPTYIKSANFKLNHAKGDSMTFQVNFYELIDGVVGERLPIHNIVIKEKQNKGVLTVDLTEYGLVLENDVLLALQWIADDGDRGNQGITFDTKKGDKLTGVYIKQYSIGAFEKADYLGKKVPCFYLLGKRHL